MENEIWVSVNNYEDSYEISSSGRIRSLDREIKVPWRNKVRLQKIKGKILSLAIIGIRENNKYYVTSLSKNGKRHCLFVHRIVCEAFHGTPPTDKHQANHKNGNKLDNNVDNLEWVTRSENMIHAYHILDSFSRKKTNRKTSIRNSKNMY